MLKLSLQRSSLIHIFVTKKPKWQLQSAFQCSTTTTTHLPLLCHWRIDDNQPSHWHMSIPLYGIWVTANTVHIIVDQPPFANLVKQITTTCTLVFTPSPSTALRSFYLEMCCCCCCFSWTFLFNIDLGLKELLCLQESFPWDIKRKKKKFVLGSCNVTSSWGGGWNNTVLSPASSSGTEWTVCRDKSMALYVWRCVWEWQWELSSKASALQWWGAVPSRSIGVFSPRTEVTFACPLWHQPLLRQYFGSVISGYVTSCGLHCHSWTCK